MWDSKARFVVVGASEFKMLTQMNLFFSPKLRIYNCINISQQHYVIDKDFSRTVNVNYADTGMELGMYTWFPYQSSYRCTEVNITLLESWVISAQGHFTKNLNTCCTGWKKQ
jgi:hypothetical protein